MKTKIANILHMKNFFKIVDQKGDIICYNLETPGRLLIQNIHSNWLRFVNTKTTKYMGVFTKQDYFQDKENLKLPVGYLNYNMPDYCKTTNNIKEYNISECLPINDTKLNFNIIVPKQDVMQFFIQWQRYRKFWWSSITTTPSLFAVNDIKYSGETAEVDIIAQYPWGNLCVESVQIKPSEMEATESTCLSCTMSLEGALFNLLLEAFTNQNKEEYLRLHRKMAPYKLSFALNCEEINKKTKLQELATLLHLKLNTKRISTWLPVWSLSLDCQIKENLQMGVTYTAVLNEQTLENGIFHLLNSSTMLKEQVHIADFEEYATILFR